MARVAAAGADRGCIGRAGAADPLALDREAAPKLRSWRAWVIWGMQSGMLALLLLLLWQPAVTIGELSSQQNIIAVVVDDSRSMALADADGRDPRGRCPGRARRRRAGRLAEALSDSGLSRGSRPPPRGRDAGHCAHGRGHAFR